MTASHAQSSTLVRAGIVASAIVFICGCGYVDYEFRLNESKKYYAYLDKVEQHLAPKWVSSEAPVELRAPKQFTLIPPPQKIQREDGSVEEPAVDPRQPDYGNYYLKLPGLVGAWESRFSVLKPDGTREERKGYLYTLTNYWELVGDQAADSSKFVSNLQSLMAEKLGVPATDVRVEPQPAGYPAYVPVSSYDVCNFKHVDIEGVFYNFEVYAKQNGSVFGVVVLVLPEGMESPQKLSERLPLMLGYFNFSKDPPRVGSSQNAPAGSPAATAPAGF